MSNDQMPNYGVQAQYVSIVVFSVHFFNHLNIFNHLASFDILIFLQLFSLVEINKVGNVIYFLPCFHGLIFKFSLFYLVSAFAVEW